VREGVWHFGKEPVDSVRKLAQRAVFTPTDGGGLRAAIEVIASPGGHVRVSSSRISGKPRNRTIVQVGEPLMFQNIDEAKDGIDLILDRLAEEAAKLDPAVS
jgi:hypothetical protein